MSAHPQITNVVKTRNCAMSSCCGLPAKRLPTFEEMILSDCPMPLITQERCPAKNALVIRSIQTAVIIAIATGSQAGVQRRKMTSADTLARTKKGVSGGLD